MAHNESSNLNSWWLRTPVTVYSNVVCLVYDNGVIGECPTKGFNGEILNGVRPAFCLPGDTPIKAGEINGEKAYFIADE